MLRRRLFMAENSGGIVIPDYDITWNPLDKSPDISVFNSNLSATRLSVGAQWSSVRATLARFAGVHQYEAKIDTASAPVNIMCGLAAGRMAITAGNVPGVTDRGWGYYAVSGNKYHNNVLAAYGATYTQNDVIGIVYDAGTGSNGTMQCYKNGVSQGVAYNNLPPGLMPCVGVYEGSSTRVLTGRFQTSDFTHPIPGAQPWNEAWETPIDLRWNIIDSHGGMLITESGKAAHNNFGAAWISATTNSGFVLGIGIDYEFDVQIMGVAGGHVMVGVMGIAATVANYCGITADGWSYHSVTGNKFNSGVGGAYGATYGPGDVITIRITSSGELTFKKNGAPQGAAYTGITGIVFPAVSGYLVGRGGRFL